MSIPAPPDDPEVALPADEAVSVDTPCRRCAYNLRGLTTSARCPECGTPIAMSLHGDLLRFATPEWVEKIARGTVFMRTGLVLAVLGVLLFGPLLIILASIMSPTLGAVRPMGSICTLVMGAVPAIAIYYGVWLCTAPDPSRSEGESVTARRLIRAAIIVAFAGSCMDWGLDLVRSPGTAALMVKAVLTVLAAAGALVGVPMFIRHLMQLSQRMSNDDLVRRGRFIFRGSVVVLGLVAVIQIVTLGGMLLSPKQTSNTPTTTPSAHTSDQVSVSVKSPVGRVDLPPGRSRNVLLAVACPLLPGALVLFSLFLRWIHDVSVQIKEQAKLARTAWAEAGLARGSSVPASDVVDP